MIELTDHNELCVYALSLALHARHAYKYMCVHEIVGVICPPPPASLSTVLMRHSMWFSSFMQKQKLLFVCVSVIKLKMFVCKLCFQWNTKT